MAADSPFRACLFPLLEALGWQGDRDSLAEYLSGEGSPADAAEFRNTMAALRFDSSSSRRSLAALDSADLPCLLVDRRGAPSCLIAKEGRAFFTFDGSTGAYASIPAKSFGKILVFKPLEEGADSILASRQDWLWILAGRFKAHLGSALAISVILGILSLVYPALIALIFEQVGIADGGNTLWSLGLGAAIFLVADSGFRYLRSAILSYASLRSGKILGEELFRRLLAFQASFTEQASAEAQVRRVKDLRTVADFVGGSALAAVFDLPFVVVMIVWLVSVGGPVALVPTLGLLAFAAASAAAYPAMKRVQASAAVKKAERMDLAATIVSGAEDIASAGMRKAWSERFAKASARSAYTVYKEAEGASAVVAISGFFVSAGGLGTLYVGVDAVLSGTMPVSTLVGSMMLVWRILGIARSTFVILSQVDSLASSIRQLQRFMALPQETGALPFTVPVSPPEGSLEFQDVSFRYGPEGYPALYAVGFKAEAGKVSALVGRQGAGKSTALKLALGLYRPQVGRVMIGAFNIRQSDPARLRRAIAYAPEEPMIMRGGLADFIRGSSGSSKARIEGLAEELGLLEALSEAGLSLADPSPEGFEEDWPDAARLTSICRACAKTAPIYLFDQQSFSRPDRYEASFQAMLRKLANTGAVVLAASEPGKTELADALIELDGGRVVRGVERRQA